MLLARSWSRFAGSVLVGRPIGDMLDNIFDSRSRRRPSSGGKADRYGFCLAWLTVMARFSALWAAFSCDLWHNPRSRKFLGHLGIVRSAIAVNLAIREP